MRLGCRLNVRIASKYVAKVGGRIFSPSSFPHSMQTCDPSPVSTYNKNAQLRCITNILTFNYVHLHFCTFQLLTSVISQSHSTCTFAMWLRLVVVKCPTLYNHKSSFKKAYLWCHLYTYHNSGNLHSLQTQTLIKHI